MRYSLGFVLLFIFISFIGFTPQKAVAEDATSTTDSSEDDSPEEIFENIRQWRRRSSEVDQKINSLGATRVESVFIPVLFGVTRGNISPNFGDPRGGGTRSHEGEDIMGVKGTPIVSPTPAVVLRIGNGASSGLTVRTANPGGETFVYMHLDKYAEGLTEGTLINTGDLIGYVGNTGNASGGAAHLHLEIRNSSNQPTDPYPRLTGEFSQSEKIKFLEKILTQSTNATTLAQFLAANFKTTFNNIQNSGVTLPGLISASLTNSTGTTVATPTTRVATTPTGDLDIGSEGTVVVELQKFLITKNTGPAAARLKIAGATGSFGPLTAAALAEFQKSVDISPATGYYGPVTRALITTLMTSSSQPTTPTATMPTGSVTFTRDLKKGMTGEDIKKLQQYLNAKGFVVTNSGAGSLGNESTYFGSATAAALIKFQNFYKAEILTPAGLTTGTGYFGVATRNFILASI